MTRGFFQFSFFALIMTLTPLNSYANSNDVIILSGDEYNAYAQELAKDLAEEGIVLPSTRSSMQATATIIKFDNLLLLKQSTLLPDWAKSESLEEYGYSLSDSDSVLADYVLEETITFDLDMLALAIAQGAEFATDDTGGIQTRGWFCSKRVKNKTKLFEKKKPFNSSVSDLTISGNYIVNGNVKYERRSRCGIPYKYSYKGVDIKFSLALDDVELDVIKLSYAVNQNLLKTNLLSFNYNWHAMAGPIPIEGDHDFNLDFLIDFFFGIELEVNNKYLLNGGLSFELNCSKSNCEQKDTLSDISVKEVLAATSYSVALTTTLTPKLQFTNYNTFRVLWIKSLEIDVKLGIAFPITYYQYFGNTCDSTYNNASQGSLLYVDMVLYGSISLDSIFSSGRTFDIDFGKLYKESIDVDKKLASIFDYESGNARLAYKNLYFKAFNSHNFLRPIVKVNKYQSDLSATLSLPNCLPDDLKSRGATYSIDWGEGYALETTSTDSGNTEVSHVFINEMENIDVKFKLEKVGDAKVSVDNEKNYIFINDEWQEVQQSIPYWYILPSINLILFN